MIMKIMVGNKRDKISVAHDYVPDYLLFCHRAYRYIQIIYKPTELSSALPNRTENGLHHIRTVSYFVKSVPAGIS